ncbi:MAG: hypothetical protein ABIP20_01155 [Chthoniobacteraceae bacterium]
MANSPSGICSDRHRKACAAKADALRVRHRADRVMVSRAEKRVAPATASSLAMRNAPGTESVPAMQSARAMANGQKTATVLVTASAATSPVAMHLAKVRGVTAISLAMQNARATVNARRMLTVPATASAVTSPVAMRPAKVRVPKVVRVMADRNPSVVSVLPATPPVRMANPAGPIPKVKHA